MLKLHFQFPQNVVYSISASVLQQQSDKYSEKSAISGKNHMFLRAVFLKQNVQNSFGLIY